jgi:hypothetical protein
MKAPSIKPVRCAIYTRVSTEHGLDQEFNSLDAQYEAASAYIKSQAHAGWTQIPQTGPDYPQKLRGCRNPTSPSHFRETPRARKCTQGVGGAPLFRPLRHFRSTRTRLL